MLHVCRIIDVRVVSIIRYMGAGTGGANFFCKVTHNHNLFDFLFSLSRFLISPPPFQFAFDVTVLYRLMIMVVHFDAIEVGKEKKKSLIFIWYSPQLRIVVYATRQYIFMNVGLIKPVVMLALTSVTKSCPPLGNKPKMILRKSCFLWLYLFCRHFSMWFVHILNSICICSKTWHFSDSFHCHMVKD